MRQKAFENIIIAARLAISFNFITALQVAIKIKIFLVYLKTNMFILQNFKVCSS